MNIGTVRGSVKRRRPAAAWLASAGLAGTACALLIALTAATPARADLLDAAAEARLRAALTALADGDWSAAAARADGLPAPLPTAVTWWRLVEQEAPLPSFAAMARFREQYPGWPRPNALAARVERAAVGAEPAAVIAHFRRFPPTSAHGRWAAARALAALGDPDTAAAFARTAWQRSSAFTAADEALFLGQFAAALTNGDHRARLDDLAWRGLAAEIERTLPLVDADWQRLIEARLWVRTGRYGIDARIDAVPAALRRDPGLLYERLRFRRLADNADGAAEILLDPPAELGDADRWWRERRRAFRAAIADEDHRLAYRLAASHGQRDGIGFADSEWHAGWLALRRLERPEDALAHFERMWAAVDTPISRARAGYWAGRAAAAAGRPGEARSWYVAAADYGIAFYGQEAGLELGRARLELGAPLPVGDPDALRESDLGRLARMLAEVGDTYLLPVVTDHLVRSGEAAATTAAAIRLAAEVGRYDSAIRGYIPLYRQGLLSAEASHPVPAHFDGLLRPADRDVAPALALAIARQESRFVSYAVSPAGARGLMQLMPGTARLVARDLGIAGDVARLTRDPAYNAALGTRYLGDLLRRFDDPALAAAGYNAGPGRSVAWIEAFGDPRRLDRHAYIDWLERIPFGETRNYVQRIIEGERVYAARLAGG